MPFEPTPQLQSLYAATLNLPPPFTLVTLGEKDDAFAYAQRLAGADTAGTLVFVDRPDQIEFALVLEPEEPLATARRVHYAGMVAMAGALATHGRPETPITFGWPNAIFFGGTLVGGSRLGWPHEADEQEVPDWLVFGGAIRTAVPDATEPGPHPHSPACGRTGLDHIAPGRFVGSFARRFLVALDSWYERGFDALARDYLQYAMPEIGKSRGIGPTGDLLVRSASGEEERRALISALNAPLWTDPFTSGERL